MGIRQTLNENPVVTAVVTAVAVLGAIFIVYKTSCSESGERSTMPTKSYFTIDDGNSYFAEDGTKIPPFDYQGKTAYRVRVFKCKDGTIFVSHLERYSDAVKKQIEAQRQKGGGITLNPTILGNMEIKKPGDNEWLNMSAGPDKYMAVLQPKCKDGSTQVSPVFPPND